MNRVDPSPGFATLSPSDGEREWVRGSRCFVAGGHSRPTGQRFQACFRAVHVVSPHFSDCLRITKLATRLTLSRFSGSISWS